MKFVHLLPDHTGNGRLLFESVNGESTATPQDAKLFDGAVIKHQVDRSLNTVASYAPEDELYAMRMNLIQYTARDQSQDSISISSLDDARFKFDILKMRAAVLNNVPVEIRGMIIPPSFAASIIARNIDVDSDGELKLFWH